MKYLTKILDYFNYFQFMNDLEKLKEEYYVIGYTVKSQENTATVELVKR